ncbi:MAG: class I SAM-dependent methyltransferase [Acidimicrobiales bacterium]
MTGETNAFERRRWNDPLWSSIWPRRERMTSEVTPYLLRHLELSGAERILEVGSGGGTATLAMAAALQSGGSVTGADISAPLCEQARRRASERGVHNARFVVADVQADVLDGSPFDAAASQFGVMFFDEPARAFANIGAQLVPGGVVAFACWQGQGRNPWLVNAALAPFVPPPPVPAPGKAPTGPFSLADPSATTALLDAAGWLDVTCNPYELVVDVGLESLADDDYLRFAGVPEERLDDAREAIDRHLDPLKRADGRYDAPLAFQVFTASTPAP